MLAEGGFDPPLSGSIIIYVVKYLYLQVSSCKGRIKWFCVYEHVLKSSCVMRFICLKNIDAGAFLL